MTHRQHGPKVRRRGGVAVVVALCMIPLIGVMAFAFDGGLLLAARRRSQTVADAAAFTAACQIYSNMATDPTGLDVSGKAKAVALANAKANGFTNDTSTNTVTVNIPPQNGTHAGVAGYAEVIVTYIQPRVFGAVLGSGTMTISARGASRVLLTQPPSVLLLDASAAPAFSFGGGSNLTTQSFITVNSSSSNGTLLAGASTITTYGLHLHGGGFRDTASKVVVTGDTAVKTGTVALADPLASLAVPASSGVTQTFSGTSGAKTLSPGIYNGGLAIGGSVTATLLPGVYYMKGGGFAVSGTATVKGAGVTIYVDNTGSSVPLSIGSGTTVTLTPPTTGTYQGLTYFQDRANSRNPSFNSGATIAISGTVYAAAADITISGGSDSYGSQIIADTLTVAGGATTKINTTDDAKLGYVAAGVPTPTSIVLCE